MALLAALILIAARAGLRFGRYGGRAIEAAAIVLSVAVVLVPSAARSGRADRVAPDDGITQTDLWRRYDAGCAATGGRRGTGSVRRCLRRLMLDLQGQ
jgi:hypothetical protein